MSDKSDVLNYFYNNNENFQYFKSCLQGVSLHPKIKYNLKK